MQRAAANGFLPGVLPENRAGRLTEEQALAVRRAERRGGYLIPLLAGAWVAAGLLVAAIGLRGVPSALARLDVVALGQQSWGGAIAGIAVAIFGGLALWACAGGTGYRADLAAGRVAMIGGIGTREAGIASATGSSATRWSYRYIVGGKRFAVTKAGHDALIVDIGIPCRAYYLPRSGRLVNIEPVASTAARSP